MSPLNLALSETLQAFVKEQAAVHGYDGEADYVRDLVQREQDRETLRAKLRKGGESGFDAPIDDAYFDELRARARKGQ